MPVFYARNRRRCRFLLRPYGSLLWPPECLGTDRLDAGLYGPDLIEFRYGRA